MKTNQITPNRKVCAGLILVSITTVTVFFSIVNVYAQRSVSPTTSTTTANATEHAAHILDNLIISEHIPLTGQLINGDYILLMDFTPFATSIEGHSHIALKVPCNENGTPKITIITGIAPNLNTLDVGNAIDNGTLDRKSNLDLSNEGKSCLYHAELPKGITDIELLNTSNQTLNFNDGGYSVTISAHGTAIQHMAASNNMTMSPLT